MNVVCPGCKKKFPIDYPEGTLLTIICDSCGLHIDSEVKKTFGFKYCKDKKREVQPK